MGECAVSFCYAKGNVPTVGAVHCSVIKKRNFQFLLDYQENVPPAGPFLLVQKEPKDTFRRRGISISLSP
jgi:hypothetical protein